MIKQYIALLYDGTCFIIVPKNLNVRECTSLYRQTNSIWFSLQRSITSIERWLERLSPNISFLPGCLFTEGKKIFLKKSVKVKVSNQPDFVDE